MKNQQQQTEPKTYEQGFFTVTKEFTEKVTKAVIESETKSFTVTEVIPNHVDRKVRLKDKFNNGHFITLFQESINDIIENGDLSKPELIILFSFIGNAGENGKLVLTQKAICEKLKLRKQNVSIAINGLIKRKIIVKTVVDEGNRRNGKSNTYEVKIETNRLNYNLAYKGKIRNFKNLIAEEEKIDINPKQLTLFSETDDNTFDNNTFAQNPIKTSNENPLKALK